MIPQELIWIAKTFILPPGILIITGLLGVIVFRGFLGKLLLITSIALLYILSTGFFSDRLMEPLEQSPALTEKQIKSSGAQAILVLAGDRDRDAPEYDHKDTIGPATLSRLRYAAKLARLTNLPVIPTGGITHGTGPSLSAMMAEVLSEEFGVKALVLEEQSRTTWEHARILRPILEKRGISKLLMVTHAWHIPRAMEAFRNTGLSITPAPTAFASNRSKESEFRSWLPSASALRESTWAIHEHIGMAWYQLKREFDL